MPFEFIQIPGNGQGSAKEELNKLLRGGRIASVRKAFVSFGDGSFWAFRVEYLKGNLERLRQELTDRTFDTGKFNVFIVSDPKERAVHATRFPERAFHHALMNLCEPVLERQAVFHSYACRMGEGRLQAIAAAKKLARGHTRQLKLDIRKYFESIRQVKDRPLRAFPKLFCVLSFYSL